MDYLITKEPEKSDYLIEPEPQTPAQPQGIGSKAADTAVSFGIGANSLLQMAGDFYGLATGDMDNAVSRQARENIQYLQRRKSPELQQAEEARRKAIESEEDELGKALTYVRQTVSNPSLLSNALSEQLPNLVGTGGVGAAAKIGAEKALLKTAATQAAKRAAAKKAAQVGTGAAVGAGAAMQGTDVGADLYDEAISALEKVSDEQAMSIPEIAQMVDEKGASLDEAKAAFALTLGREAFALSAPISAASQMLPGGRTIERAFVGKQVARPVAGAISGALGEAASEAVEEGGSRVAANILARRFEPERPLAKGVGEAVGQAAVVGGVPGAAFGAASSRPTPQPAPEVETTAGKSEETPASAATRERLTERPRADLTRSEEMSPEEFWASVNVRHANLMGGQPSPEDVEVAGGVAPAGADIDTEKAKQALDMGGKALAGWRESNPSAPENIVLIYDPEMLHNGYGVQGAYNRNNGGILINTAFVAPERIGAIVNHEWAHATLATVEGQQALAKFAEDALKRVNLGELQSRYGKKDPIVLLEEWIAQNQEQAPSVIREIVARIREWLAQFNIVDLNDGEVADIMLRTLRELESNKVQPDIDVTGIEAEGQTPETAYSLAQTKAPEFKEWSKGLPVIDGRDVDTKDLPSSGVFRVYHGSKQDFSTFKTKSPDGLFFTSLSPEFASNWAFDRDLDGRQPRNYPAEIEKAERKISEEYFKNNYPGDDAPQEVLNKFWENQPRPLRDKSKADAAVYPLYAKAEKIFNPTTDYKLVEPVLNSMESMEGVVKKGLHKTPNWVVYENKPVVDFLKSKGYDAMWLQESSLKDAKPETLALFDNTQLKSASGNVGTYGQRPVTEEEAARTGLTAEQANVEQAMGDIRFSLASRKQEDIENLKKWAKDSAIVDGFGLPIQMYHGSDSRDFNVFRPNRLGLIFGTPNPDLASEFSGARYGYGGEFKVPQNARVYPVFMRAKNPFDYENPEHIDKVFGDSPEIVVNETKIPRFRVERGNWIEIEQLTNRIKDLGFDGLYVQERNTKNLAVFSPNQITSSSGNVGSFGQRPVTEEEAARTGLTAEQANRAQAEGDIRFSIGEQPIAKGRDTVLARAAQGVKAGEVTPKEYNRMVNKRMPLEPFEEVPTPATDDEVLLGLGDLMAGNRRKRDLKANPEDIEGQQVEARLDIPAYESKNVWVVTLHQPREREGAAGTVLAYTPTAVLQNVTFSVNETAALNVAGGKRKSSFATMNGEYVPMTARSAYEMANEAKDSGDWVEVGMNPIRHSYFYDKSDQRPVVSAEEVIQVGGMVLARGVEYGEKGDYKYSLQNPERPASGIMASPSITDIDYSRAKRNLTSANQARFKSQVTDYAPEATVYDAVGDWADGAENSVAAIFEGSRSTEELEELAAKAGLAGDQKAVLWWTTDPKGKDAIHRVIWPKGVSMDDARQAMIDVGLENRTLIQTPDGIQGFVFDQGQQNINKIEELHEHSTEPALESESATGDFLGSWTSRTEGRRAYRRVLGSTPQAEAGDGGERDRVERAGGEPEAGREQPDIRYSLTGDAVGVRALEDAKTTKFKNQKGTAKYLGDLLKSEFPEGLDRMDPEAAEKLADLLDRELSLALTMPDNANAIGWYGREMEKVVEILRSPELNYELDNPVNRGVFNALLAITSNGQEVVDQFLKSAQLYEKWKKTGKIPSLGKWGGERNRAMAGQIKFLNQMLGLVGAEDTVGFLTSESSLREHLDNLYGMVAEARGLPEKATVAAKEAAIGKYLNAGMPTGELKDYNTVGAIVFGPKLGGGFFANLYGKFDRLTMDRWFMRTFHRLTGRLGFVDDRAIQGALDEARRDLGAVEYLVQTAAGAKKDAFDPVSKDRLSDSDLLAYIKSEGKKAFKNYREINAGLKENPEDASLLLQDTLRRTYNRIIKAESGLFDAPDNGSHRVFIRDVLNRVQQQRAQRGEKHIDTSDIQAILWYLEKDIWDKLKDKKEKAQDELDEQDEDDDDSAGRVSYSNGALELYRRKTGKDYVFKSGNQPERAQVLASD